jgi:hypothetical protein
MEHLPKLFHQKNISTQRKIVEIGLYCWSLIEHELDSQKEMDQADLISVWKEKGRTEAKLQAEEDYTRLLKKKDDQIQSLEYEKERIESQVKKQFEQEKSLLIKATRLDVEQEYQAVKEEKIRLETKLETQDDFQVLCRSLVKENAKLKEVNEKLTETKSSATIGKDGENLIDVLLSGLHYEYEKTSDEAEKADFRITTENKLHFILDSKKYKKNVGKKEKDKLIRDVDGDATVNGGILVSLLSGITHHASGDIITTPNSKPILFISLMGMTEQTQIEFLNISIKLLEKYTSLNEQKERADLAEKIKATVPVITDSIQRFKNIAKNAEKMLEDAKVGLSQLEPLYKLLIKN